MSKLKSGIAVPESYLPFKKPDRPGWEIIAKKNTTGLHPGDRGTLGVKQVTWKGAWASFKEEIYALDQDDVEQIVDILIGVAENIAIIDGVINAPVPVVKENGKWRVYEKVSEETCS